MQENNKEKTLKITENIVEVINNEKLTPNELISILATLLFSVGESLEGCRGLSSEKILTRFATQPTLGNALMAQGLHMKETWVKNKKEETDDRTERNIPGQTEKT
jgi:hypothetical protein